MQPIQVLIFLNIFFIIMNRFELSIHYVYKLKLYFGKLATAFAKDAPNMCWMQGIEPTPLNIGVAETIHATDLAIGRIKCINSKNSDTKDLQDKMCRF